jgi:two-component system cell cycle response regulator DivK
VRGNDDPLRRNPKIVMSGELILIIEDNEKNRKLARDVLQVKGYQTIESETAEEGIELAREKSPALILMDIQLPGIDGITALKQLRAEPKTKSIPVMAITASAMTHNRQTMLAEGFDGYQTKPISLKDFLGEVERVLAAARS